jgi:hypothetical protein
VRRRNPLLVAAGTFTLGRAARHLPRGLFNA